MPEIIVVKRPRTYANRKWLDGYSHVSRLISTRYLSLRGARLAIQQYVIFPEKWTATERGFIDALLDSVGC
jgi:hypothetical protein